MAWKSDFPTTDFSSNSVASAIRPPVRRFYGREILGLLQALVALLIFLSLFSDRRGDQWIGPLGDRLARDLAFAVGRDVAYFIPGLLALNALFALFGGEERFTDWRGVMRFAGAWILLISLCGVMTLIAVMRRVEDPTALFAAGGIVGNFIVDAEGLDLPHLMGRIGAMILLGGMSLIGAVMSTELLIREAGHMLMRIARIFLLPLRLLEIIGDRFVRLKLRLAAAWSRFVGAFFAGLNFRPRRSDRIMSYAPIRELRPVGTLPRPTIRPPRLEDDPFDDPDESYDDGQPIDGDNLDADRELGSSDNGEYSDNGDYGDATYDDEPLDERDSRDDPSDEPKPYENCFRMDRRPAILSDSSPEDIDEESSDRDSYSDAESDSTDSAAGVGYEAIDEAPPESSSRVFRLRRRKPAPPPILKPDDQPQFEFPKVFTLPPLDHLADPPPAVYRMTQEEAEEISRKIEQTLLQFKIEVEVVEVVQGPTVTRFAMRIAPGIRVSKILALENDLALALRAQQVRILAPIPGQAAVGIEVPNRQTNGVYLKELLESDAFKRSKSPLAFALGKNISGEAVIADLAQMPHVLIAGATGAGKSVCLNTIIASLLFRNTPDKVKFVMIDPKRVELAIYQAIPHLIAPVVCEPRKAAAALAWTVEQMENRYKLLAEIGVRNIDGYNAIVNDKQPNKKAMGRELKYMPHIVVVIDELADLMMVAKNEVEEFIIRLAQMARAVGIHLIVATQRPSVNVITGIIKANFPSRIAFRVSSKVDSRTILDMNGAQALLGRGDMLYSPGGVKPFRIQGAYVADEEIERLADYIRSQEKARYEKEDFEAQPTAAQRAKAQLMMSISSATQNRDVDNDNDGEDSSDLDALTGAESLPNLPTAGRVNAIPLPPADMENLSDEDLYDVALKLVLESRKASVSYIQRRLKIGYARAGRVMDMMEENGIVGPYQGSKPRDLIVDPAEYMRRLAEIERDA